MTGLQELVYFVKSPVYPQSVQREPVQSKIVTPAPEEGDVAPAEKDLRVLGPPSPPHGPHSPRASSESVWILGAYGERGPEYMSFETGRPV